MTCALTRFIYEDPILLAMARHEIDWADTFTKEDELALQEYNTIGEGAAILASLKAFMDNSIDSNVDAEAEEFEELLRTPRTVRWADDVSVTGVALPVAVAPVAIAPVAIAKLVTPIAAPTAVPITLVTPVTPTDDGFQVVSKAPKAPKVDASQAQQAQVNPRSIRTIIARNLPRTITDLELRKRFGAHSAVQDIYIPKNTTPGKYFGTIKGFALIKFHTPKDSTKAFLAEKDALFLGGNAVTLEFANQDR